MMDQSKRKSKRQLLIKTQSNFEKVDEMRREEWKKHVIQAKIQKNMQWELNLNQKYVSIWMVNSIEDIRRNEKTQN